MDADIPSLEHAVQAAPDNTPEQAEALNTLAKALWRNALMSSDQETLQSAIAKIGQAVEMSRTHKIPKLAGYLNNLGQFLMDLGSMSGQHPEYTEQAVSVLREGAACAKDPLRPVLLLTLGNALRNLWQCQPAADVLAEAISVYQEGLDASPSLSTRLNILNGLAACHIDMFNAGGGDPNMEHLQRASDLAEEAVESSDDDHPSRAVFLDTYAVVLDTLFTHYPSREILEEAINHYYLAVELAARQQSPKALQFTVNLVDALRILHKADNTGTSLDDGLSMLEPALQELPGPPEVVRYGKWCYSLCLLYRFVRDGDENDITTCIDTLSTISDQVPEDSIRGLQYRCGLAEALIIQFDQSSDVDNLDRAIDVLKQCVVAVDSVEFETGSTALNTGATVYLHLSVALLARFDLRGSLDDLNSASEAAQRALATWNESSIDYTLALVACGNCLLRAHQETEQESYLNDAIAFYQDAVDVPCVWDSFRPGRLYTLGYALQRRFGLHGAKEDWERCLAASEEAVQLTEDQPSRFLPLGQLGNAYLAKSLREGAGSEEYIVDLEHAVSHLTDAVAMMPKNHSCAALWLNNLGKAHDELHRQRGSADTKSLQQALSVYREAAELESASSLQRVTAAYRAIDLLASRPEVDLHRAADFSRLVVQLLPGLSPRLLRKQDQQAMISNFSGLGNYATSALLAVGDDPVEAVQALEATRGVVNSMLIDTRTDLSDLEERDAQLAAEFKSASNILDKATSSSEFGAAASITGGMRSRDAEDIISASKAFDSVVGRIRQLDGFRNFLMAQTAQEIQLTAGPFSYIILINISSLRSDALVVERTRIWSMELPALVMNEAVSWANNLTLAIQDENAGTIGRLEANETVRDVLAWLWRSLVSPVLESLPSLPDGSQHRICWIPTGVMTNLPIHAATDATTGSNAMDTIISSYATTIKSLRHAQQHLSHTPEKEDVGTALLLAMQQTPSQSDLPFAPAEVSTISRLLSPILPVRVLSHPPTSSSAETVTKPAFLSHLASPTAPVSILHLSCHGIACESDPSDSRLLLPDWQTTSPEGPGPLTVSDIASHRLPAARLAYLSACHAASTKTPWLLDEGLNLAAAFQLAGFPQVVGTLWQVSDRRAGGVAEGMWRGVLCGGRICYDRVAEAVNAAVRRLREETRLAGDEGEEEDDDDSVDMQFDDEPFLWAGIVYMGW